MATANLHRRKLDLHTFDEIMADVEHLHSSGYRRAGNWDLSQILDHVGTGAEVAIKGTPNKGPWIIRRFIGPILLKQVLKKRRMRANLKVPKWWLPGPGTDESAAINQFRTRLDALKHYQGPTKPHPFLGEMTAAQWKDLVSIHASHHLSFLIPNG